MDYNLYQRKDTNISQAEVEWIDKNLEAISQKENVLFIFQGEDEALVITNKSIYFPIRKELQNLRYNQINKIKLGGDYDIELTNHKLKSITIKFVTPIDKVKMNLALNLIKKNNAQKITTTVEDIQKLFDDFTVIKHPPNQNQHKLPQVYLKEFGYLYKEQWMVSIIKKGEKFTRQKSIGSFTAETNVFDIVSEDDRFPRMFESINCDLENLYHEMLKDLDDNDKVIDKCWEIIVQFTPNMMVRSDYWRNFVRKILESEHKSTFLEITISVLSKSYEDLQKLKEKSFYKHISEGKITNSKLNKVLILFLNYILYHLNRLELIILEAPANKEFFTSDTPVNFIPNQIEGKYGLFNKDTEVYFPLSPKYLAYFRFKGSENSNIILNKLKNRGIYKIIDVMSEEEYNNLIRNEIIETSNELIIAPIELKFKL
ncbi:uncharacterized protein DUF4238 [Maribacter spongiicola]|uniref:Uncharacterized protein DUF4238 n=1 Tax=Maribacter spongiicola TaxID=1206753 RepID=A0A4R7JUG5_9FLAO|nr:DUF4238 domain-containing protein [Maribacter spongiicola]TDT41970.1 uncharacterized protein DUF4238 [Maribacter spongiicola]